MARIPFLRKVSERLIDFSGCSGLEFRLTDEALQYRWTMGKDGNFRFEEVPFLVDAERCVIPALETDTGLETLCREMYRLRFNPELKYTFSREILMVPDTREVFTLQTGWSELEVRNLDRETGYLSLLLLPFETNGANLGLGILGFDHTGAVHKEDLELYESLFQTLGVGIAFRRSQAALNERIKELSCLYGLNQIVQQSENATLEEMMTRIVQIIPPAFQFPEITACRIELPDRVYISSGYQSGGHLLSAPIPVHGGTFGQIKVVYNDPHSPDAEPVHFLEEEQKLLEIIARKLGLVIERWEARQQKSEMERQLQHADRLATIGQLSAGLAHELNEPLATILGYAELAAKSPCDSGQTRRDLERIVTAALHSREIVKKLLLFARQMPTRKQSVNLNQIVEEGLMLTGSRGSRVTVVRELAPDLPSIQADPAQMVQVIVNLTVNAIQSMPQGGTLSIKTSFDHNRISLFVSDTGCGIIEENLDRIFLPFFTTKDIGEGTGLGLPVVHGIVEAHGGRVLVDSEPGVGTTFEVRFVLEKG